MTATAIVGANTSLTHTPRSGSGTVTDLTGIPYPPGYIATKFDGILGERRYKWVLVEDLDLVSGNAVIYTTDDNGYEVTADTTGGTGDTNQPAGVALGTVTDGDFCFIQTYGICEVATVTDNGVAAGDELIIHATTNGGFDTSAGVSSVSFGHAMNDDTGTALAADGDLFLDCPKG